MAFTFGTYGGNLVLDYLDSLGLYLSLHTADPGLTGANEITTAGTNGYARQLCAFDAAASKSMANTAIETFGAFTSDLSAATYYGLWTAATGGSFVGGGDLASSVDPGNTDSIQLAAGALVLTA